MQARHLKLVTLERFAASELDSQAMNEARRHLSTCESCRSRLRGEVIGGREVLERLAFRSWPAEAPSDYEKVFERLEETTLERLQSVQEERLLAPRRAEELAGLSFAEQRHRIETCPRFHSAALADLLLEESATLILEDAARGEELVRLVLDIAERVSQRHRGRPLANDLCARAWGVIGNAHRAHANLQAAEMAFLKAEAFLEEGSGDPLERARLLDLKVSLLRSQRRFEPALAAIDQVLSIYRRVREKHREGRALISKAMIYGYAGEPEKGISLFLRAVELIDFEKEPRLALAALNNLLVDLTELGRLQEAHDLLPAVRKALARGGSRADHLNVRWAEAQLKMGLGQLEEAETKLRGVCDEFIAQEIGYDAALVLLDLAKIYLRQGRTAETRTLVAEMHPIFATLDIHREALVALAFFQKAVEQEHATVQLVEEITSYLRRSRGNPGLRFERPA